MTRGVPHAVLATALAVFLTACDREPGPRTVPAAAEPQADTHPEEENAIHLSEDMLRDLRLSTARVEERTGAQEVMALGELAPDESRYAEVAPPTGAQVVRVLAATNAPVARDAPLAELRSSDLGRARADLASADARVDLTRQALERKRALADERIVARREVQEAEAAFLAAQAERRAAVALLQALGAGGTGAGGDSGGGDGSLFVLRSPIDGHVIARQAVIGRFADPGTPLFTIADLARLWMIARAYERDAVRVPVGSIAHVTLAALPGEQFDGRVTLVGRQVDAGSRTLPVRIELENPGGILRPGMSAAAQLQIGGADRTLLAVPTAALQRVGNRWLAFVPHGAGEFEMRAVGRGRDLGNEVEVVSGLRAGESVVVDGAFLLKAEAEKRAGGASEHGH